jgi:hypothetical protein
MSKHFGRTRFTVVITILMMALAAQAANLTIDDSVEGKVTLVHDANWEGGVNSNGTAFGPGGAGSTTVDGETGAFSGSFIANAAGSPNPGTGVIYFVDSSGKVSDIVRAAWSGQATVSFQIQSSACGANLGSLPAAFAGFGVQDPEGAIQILGLFRDPDTAAPVALPSNITIQFVASSAACLETALDIKFCSNPNAFNCKAPGKTPITIFGTSSVDVTKIDVTSLRLCLASNPSTCTTSGPQSFSIGDRGAPTDVGAGSCKVIDGVEQNFLNPDGIQDLEVTFDTQEVALLIGCDGLAVGATSATLIVTGKTMTGTSFATIPVGNPGVDQLVVKQK